MTNEQFRFLDNVRITEGFYKDYEGTLTEEFPGTCSYEVQLHNTFGKKVIVDSKSLEKIIVFNM